MTEPAPVYNVTPPAARPFQAGDIVVHKDNLATTYVVIAPTTGAIVYARFGRGYIRVLNAADCVLCEPEPRRAAFDAACWLEEELP